MTGFKEFPRDGEDISAENVALALSGLVVRESSGLPREGMLSPGPTVGAVAASWKVQVGAFVYARQADRGIRFSGVSDAEQVDILPAAGNIPAGQARIDVVCWNPTAAVLTVVQGTPAASPTVPGAGALVPVLQVRVNAGDGMVIAGQVTPVFQLADRIIGKITQLAPGYTVTPLTRLERDAGGMVDAYVELTGPAPVSTDTWMATLPTGFRPGGDTEIAGAVSQGGSAAPVFVRIRANGGVYVFNPAPGNKRVSFAVRYKAVS